MNTINSSDKTSTLNVDRGMQDEVKKLHTLLDHTLEKKDALKFLRFEAFRVLSGTGQQLLGPLSARHIGYLLGGLTSASIQGGTESRIELKINEHHRKQANNVMLSLIKYINDNMPECEREIKEPAFLTDRIKSIAQSQAMYTRAIYTTYTSAAAASIAACVLGATSLPFLAACIPSSIVSYFVGKKNAKLFKEANASITNAQNQTGRAVQNALNTQQLGESAKQKSLSNLESSIRYENEQWSAPQNAGFKNSLLSHGTNFLINLGVVSSAYFLGDFSLPQIAALYAATTGFSTASSTFWSALTRKISSRNNISNQIQDLAHSKIYDLEYGREHAPLNTNSIILKNIRFSHRDSNKKSATAGFKLSTPTIDAPGEFVIGPGITVLGGRSGAGKTTLYTLLRHGDDLDSGQILFGNDKEIDKAIPITSLTKGALDPYVSSGYQSISGCDDLSPFEFVKTGGADILSDEMITQHALSIGLDINTKTTFGKLSPGQQKRAIFLRTLLSGADIMFFDEPTSGVDEATARVMLQKINEAASMGKSIIFTTHSGEELFKNINLKQDEDEQRLNINQILHLSFQTDENGNRKTPTTIQSYPCSSKEEIQNYVYTTNQVTGNDLTKTTPPTLKETYANQEATIRRRKQQQRMSEWYRSSRASMTDEQRAERWEKLKKHRDMQKLCILSQILNAFKGQKKHKNKQIQNTTSR